MKRRILVIEDDIDIRELVIMTLEESGFDVLGAQNGAEALQRLQEPDNFVILILDMRLPIMNGWQFAAAVRKDPQHSTLPIIVLTAAADAQRWAADIGAQGYLAKPFSTKDLCAAVKGILAPC